MSVCPELKTLRRIIADMAGGSDLKDWMHECARDWMEADPAEAGYLYVDGHVRVYVGSKAAPPRQFVSRQRLCTASSWSSTALFAKLNDLEFVHPQTAMRMVYELV